jgi:hypothetical protein
MCARLFVRVSSPGRRPPDGHRIDGCPGFDTQCTRYIDQCPEGEGDTGDIGLELAKTHGVPVYSSINQCLCCGGSELAVDGVIMVGEHGDYPCARASRRTVWRCVWRRCLCSMARQHAAQCKRLASAAAAVHTADTTGGHAAGGTRRASTSSRESTSWSRSSASSRTAAALVWHTLANPALPSKRP